MTNFRRFVQCLIFLCCYVVALGSVYASSHTMPSIQTWTTSQGVSVYFVHRSRQPMLDINVVFNAGSSRDPQGMYGLSEMTASLFNQGTTTLSADQIAEQLGDQGSLFEASSTQDWMALHLRSLTDVKALEPSIALLHRLITQPSFTQTAVEQKKAQAKIALKYASQNPAEVAKQAFFKALYGSGPYGHTELGTVQGIDAITPHAVQSFYHRYVVLKNAQIIIVGDLSVAQATELSEQLLVGLSTGRAALALPHLKAQRHVPVDVSFHSQQATILLGYLGITRNNPDYFALLVGNHIFGGMPLSSLLFNVVRNQHGLAYSVISALQPLQQPGPWFVFMQTQAPQSAEAIQYVEKVIARMKTQPVTDEQLKAGAGQSHRFFSYSDCN